MEMKAKIKPRINLENRTKLEEVIPLNMPMILFMDPSSICNFKCIFCPTGHLNVIKNVGSFNGLMNFNLYKKIIDDLKEFNKPLKILRLYKEGEPLINKKFADMVRYAKNSRYVNYIDTTTNGYLLTSERIKPILSAGLDRINISVCGMSDEQFLKFAGVKIKFDKYVNNIKNFYDLSRKYNCEVCIKITGDFLNEEEKDNFYKTFGNYADRISIENIAPCWPEFDVEYNSGITISKTMGIYNQPISTEQEVNICPYIFYSTTINSDGSVSLCFLDWAHKLIIGDVKQNSLKKIWEGGNLFQYQLCNLEGKRKKISSCKYCGQLTYGYPDNIDPYADILIGKLVKRKYKE